MSVTYAERLMLVSFVIAALFGALIFVLASSRVPLSPSLVAGGITFLAGFFVVYVALWLSGYADD